MRSVSMYAQYIYCRVCLVRVTLIICLEVQYFRKVDLTRTLKCVGKYSPRCKYCYILIQFFSPLNRLAAKEKCK